MKTQNSAKFLRITLLAGLLLVILSGVVLTVFYLIERSNTRITRQEDNFFRLLREYDSAIAVFYGTEREYEHLNNELDRLEKNAISVESWLSVLKRRRNLSLYHRPSLANYHLAINRALSVYPMSAPITALAAAALVKDTALNAGNETKLRGFLQLINDDSFNALRLSFHVLLGDFKNPQRASALYDLASDGTEEITVDLALLKILRGDYRGAAADVQTMVRTESRERFADNGGQSEYYGEQIAENRISDNVLRFAGDFYFDFGDLLRSAEFFFMLGDEISNARRADAMYLAGYQDIAVSIWNELSELNNETSLYNLAVIALEQSDNAQVSMQALPLLERLNRIDTISDNSRALNARQFALIRYSRTQEMPRAVAILQANASLPSARFPFIDLEICRRSASIWNLGRQTAEAWLLLDRHANSEELYMWVAWYLFFQRRADEIPIFIDRLNMKQFDSEWADIYRAAYLMNNGNLQAAESILLSIPQMRAGWLVHANLGRIYEELRSPARALSQYELAFSKQQTDPEPNPKSASRLQQRIARCFITQNRPTEAMRTLLYALELDSENLSARQDLERLLY